MAKTKFPRGSTGPTSRIGSDYIPPFTPGDVWWVNSAKGTDAAGYGRAPDAPFATLNYAAGQATANNGDTIYALPGHAETISTAGAVSITTAGVAIVGVGEGSLQPTITSGSDTLSTFVVGAANVRLENLRFVCGIDAQVIMLDLNSTDTTVKGCEFRNATAAQMSTAIDVNGGGANACDRVKVQDCLFRMSAVGSARAIELGEVADGVRIERCIVWGDFDDACIHNPTGKVLTNLTIRDCELTNLQTGDHSIELVSACTGNLIGNYYHNDMTQATGVDPGSCFSFNCYHDDVIDTSGIIAPAVT